MTGMMAIDEVISLSQRYGTDTGLGIKAIPFGWPMASLDSQSATPCSGYQAVDGVKMSLTCGGAFPFSIM